MKKYIKPCAKTIKVDNSAILAGSPLGKNSDPIDGGNVGGKRGRNSFIFEDDYED